MRRLSLFLVFSLLVASSSSMFGMKRVQKKRKVHGVGYTHVNVSKNESQQIYDQIMQKRREQEARLVNRVKKNATRFFVVGALVVPCFFIFVKPILDSYF